MKFLADMGIAPQTAAWLRRLGYDAMHLSEQGLERLADAAILEKARLESRVVLTHDLDFPELAAASGANAAVSASCSRGANACSNWRSTSAVLWG